MKKLLLLIVCLLAVSTISAQNGLTLKSGDPSVLGKDARALVFFDYSKTVIGENDISLEDYIDQKGYKFESKWEKIQIMSHTTFIKQFNKKSTGLKLNVDSTGREKYKMVIQIRKIELGSTTTSLLPIGNRKDGGATLFGRLIIKDKTGANVCVLGFAGIQGEGVPGIDARMVFAYQALRSTIIRYMKKISADTVDVDEDEDDEEEDVSEDEYEDEDEDGDDDEDDDEDEDEDEDEDDDED